jgi:hypothetical protein
VCACRTKAYERLFEHRQKKLQAKEKEKKSEEKKEEKKEEKGGAQDMKVKSSAYRACARTQARKVCLSSSIRDAS